MSKIYLTLAENSNAFFLTVLIICFMFRKPIASFIESISNLLDRLKKATKGDLSAEFNHRLQETDKAAAHFAIDKPDDQKIDPFKRWLGISPRTAILTIWVDIERELRELSHLTIPQCYLNAPPIGITSLLRHYEVINEDMFQAIVGLRNTRYTASRAEENVTVTEEQARLFAVAAHHVVSDLQSRIKVLKGKNVLSFTRG